MSIWRSTLAYYRALWAVLRALAGMYVAQPPRRSVPAGRCQCAIGYVYLVPAAVVPVLFTDPASRRQLLRTDLGNGRSLYFHRVAPDGSLVFRQVDSVYQLVVLRPGFVVPDRSEDRIRLALEATVVGFKGAA